MTDTPDFGGYVRNPALLLEPRDHTIQCAYVLRHLVDFTLERRLILNSDIRKSRKCSISLAHLRQTVVEIRDVGTKPLVLRGQQGDLLQ